MYRERLHHWHKVAHETTKEEVFYDEVGQSYWSYHCSFQEVRQRQVSQQQVGSILVESLLGDDEQDEYITNHSYHRHTGKQEYKERIDVSQRLSDVRFCQVNFQSLVVTNQLITHHQQTCEVHVHLQWQPRAVQIHLNPGVVHTVCIVLHYIVVLI